MSKLLQHRLFHFLLFFLFVLVFKYPVLSTPLYLDERDYLGEISNAFSLEPGPLGHSKLLPLVYQLLSFGQIHTPSALHLVTVFFASLALFFTYKLAKEFMGERLALMSSLLLFFSPFFFAQAGMILPDLPTAALAIMACYFVFKKRLLLSLVTGSLLILSRESALGIWLPLSLFLVIHQWRSPKRLRTIVCALTPFFFFLLFVLFSFLTRGKAFPQAAGADIFFNLENIETNTGMIFYWIFLAQGRFLITLALMMAFVFSFKKNKSLPHELSWVMIFQLALFLFFIFHGGWLKRYFLPCLPLFFVMGVHAFKQLIKNKMLLRLSLSACLAFFCLNIYGHDLREESCHHPMHGTFDHNMQYLDILKAQDLAINEILSNYRGKKIHSSSSVALRFDEQGLNFVSIDYHQQPLPSKEELAKPYDVLLYCQNCNPRENQFIKVAILQRKLVLKKVFNVGNKITAIFVRPDLESSDTQKSPSL